MNASSNLAASLRVVLEAESPPGDPEALRNAMTWATRCCPRSSVSEAASCLAPSPVIDGAAKSRADQLEVNLELPGAVVESQPSSRVFGNGGATR